MAETSVNAPATKLGLVRNMIGWILCLLIAFVFTMAGGVKVIGTRSMVQEFNHIGIGQWFRYLTGTFELAGAVGVLIPRFSRWAALLLAAVMAGAIIAHLTVLHSPPTLPAVLLVLTLVVAWLRR